MKQILAPTVLMAMLLCSALVHAQGPAGANTSAPVPTLINYSGTLTGLNGKPITSITGVTFLLYKDEQGAAPLWLETQNVVPDQSGHYTVQLGSTTSQGLPTDVFASGEARWLAVQPEGQAEQPRVLLLSVPYALKAGDAQTIGGLPASAFMLANGTKETAASGTTTASASASSKNAPPANPDVTGKGVVDYIPMWDTTSDIIDSIIFQKSSAIGIGTTAPAATLDVNGKGAVRDTLTLVPKSTDNALAVSGTTFNISSKGLMTFVAGQTFPGTGTITGITTASGSGLSGGGTKGTLNLSIASAGVTNAMLKDSSVTLNANSAGGLTTPGAMTLGSTYTIGLKPCSANQILEYSASVWNCTTPATGTITGVTAGSDLTGGGTSGSVTLNVDTTKVPLLSAGNIFTNSNTFNANSGGPILALNNTGTGDGIDLAAQGGTGVNVVGSVYGVQATGTTDGGYFTGTGTSGIGVYGLSTSSTGDYVGGVLGVTSSSEPDAFGVEGAAPATSGTPLGVYGWGYNLFSIGVWGQNGSESGTGTSFTGRIGSGVWGDGGTVSTNVGVTGTVDDGTAGYFINNSPDGYDTLLAEAESGASAPFVAIDDATGGICYIDANADLNCSGTKNAVVPVDGGARTVALSAIESPKNWFEDFGSAQLVNGAAVVALDSEFTQTVNTTEEYQVFLTPYGDCRGLYVWNRTANSFEVHELGGGSASVNFGYRITALRRKYENVRFADHTHDLDSLKRMRERMKMSHAQPQPHAPVRRAIPAPGSSVKPVALAASATSTTPPVALQPPPKAKQ
jgi:hypothetical protein